MPSTPRLRAGASLLLSLLSLGPNGLVLLHYVGMYAHVRSWEGAKGGRVTPHAAFHQMTSPQVSFLVAGLIAVALLLAWAARGLVGRQPSTERVGLAASAARFSSLGLLLGGFEAVVLIGLLAARASLRQW